MTTESAVRTVALWPDECLRIVARELTDDEIQSNEIRALAEIIRATLKFHAAYGLAATQLGVPYRVCAVRVFHTGVLSHFPSVSATSSITQAVSEFMQDKTDRVVMMANPQVLIGSLDDVMQDEYCLSIPGVKFRIPRKTDRVTVTYNDLEDGGKEHTLVLTGISARCVLHEVDHLDGITLMDKCGPIQRDMAQRKIKKYKKQGRWVNVYSS